jgi:hypothetical protein
MLFSRLIKSAAALALLTIGFAAPVHAQQNKPIISGTWYEDRATNNMNGPAVVLTLSLAQAPTNQFLNITHVSCTIQTGLTTALTDVALQAGTSSGASDLNRPMSVRGSVIAETGVNNKFYSIVTDQIFYKVGLGKFPSIVVSAATPSGTGANGIEASCTIVGSLSAN